MQVLSKEMLEISRPEASLVREWLKSPVTERLFNVIYRLDTGSQDVAVRDGFKRCQAQVLDFIVDFEAVCQPPPVVESPETDYNSAELLRRRDEELGIRPR